MQLRPKNGPPSGGDDRYKRIFDDARVALWDEDFSAVCLLLEDLRKRGVSDIRAYFSDRPQELADAVKLVAVRDVNRYAAELFEAADKTELLGQLGATFLPETAPIFLEELVALWEGRQDFQGDAVVRTLKGNILHVTFTMTFRGEHCENTLVSILDVTRQKSLHRRYEALARTGRILSSDLDLERIVQSLTDIATELSGAAFGAFFYNVIDAKGERYVLYTISGCPASPSASFRCRAIRLSSTRPSGASASSGLTT